MSLVSLSPTSHVRLPSFGAPSEGGARWKKIKESLCPSLRDQGRPGEKNVNVRLLPAIELSGRAPVGVGRVGKGGLLDEDEHLDVRDEDLAPGLGQTEGERVEEALLDGRTCERWNKREGQRTGAKRGL